MIQEWQDPNHDWWSDNYLCLSEGYTDKIKFIDELSDLNDTDWSINECISMDDENKPEEHAWADNYVEGQT